MRMFWSLRRLMSILIAIALTFFANLGLSIIFGIILLTYKQISQLVNIVSLLVFLCCLLVVLAGILPGSLGFVVQLIPLSQSAVLFDYAFNELVGCSFDLLCAIAYLISFGLLTLAIAIPVFRRAERYARIKGLIEREHRF